MSAPIIVDGAMQIPATGSGCGGIVDAVAQTMQKIVNPDSGSQACDRLFRSSLYAMTLERYSTVFPRFVSSTPAAVGGNLIHVPNANAEQDNPMEFFRNGVLFSGINSANPLSVAPAIGTLLAGEGAPFPLSLNETNCITQTASTGQADNADLVTAENHDFVVGGIALEYSGLFTVDDSGVVPIRARRVEDAFLFTGDASYEERLWKWLFNNCNLRVTYQENGTDRTYRLGRPMDWPSYTGYFGSKAMTNGQPTPFAFKELPFAMQTNRRPKLSSNARVRFILDFPQPANVPNNAAIPVPANLSNLTGSAALLGSVFAGITIRLFGVMVCVNPTTGRVTEDVDLKSKIAEGVADALRNLGISAPTR